MTANESQTNAPGEAPTQGAKTAAAAPLTPAAEPPARPYFPTRPAKRRLVCAYEQAARMYDAHP